MTTFSAPALILFRDDLRLFDNPALAAAMEGGRRVVGLFVLDEASPGLRPLGGAAKWWLHHSLRALSKDAAEKGLRIHMIRGKADEIAPDVARALGAGLVTWNRRYGAAEQAVDASTKSKLQALGIQTKSFNGTLLHEPWEVRNGQGLPFKVFTPFWRAARANATGHAIQEKPNQIKGINESLPIATQSLDDVLPLPATPDWAGGLRAAWTPGESSGNTAFSAFLDAGLAGYATNRDRPDLISTSRLSPHLRFGEVSIRRVLDHAEHRIRHAEPAADPLGTHALACPARASAEDVRKFQAELGWREFAHHLLGQFPALATENFQPAFDRFPWRDDPAGLKAWQRGRTGYPIVDAGMRELWTTGWMHNRVRMITASFLVKHLLIDWRAGERWFWDTLVDACAANNTASWQWVAGTGADAAPYFRIFNPVLQGEKFDPDGAYVKRWVPELARLPAHLIHRPWEAPRALAPDYPPPIVDHALARDRALAALTTIKTLPAGRDG